MRWPEAGAALLALSGCAPALAQDAPVQLTEAPALARLPEERERSLWERLIVCEDRTDRSRGWLRHFVSSEGPVAPIFGTRCALDWHKGIYTLPYSYSPDYESDQTEVLFGVSAKLRPLGPQLYFAYSQRSFWSLYDRRRSRPFRETVYNPEVFYRWTPRPSLTTNYLWGLDAGYEHESNGEDIPASRSWNRLFVAPYWERRRTAVQLRAWYRLPESGKKDEEDPNGDDNPDIEDFVGHGELHVFHRPDADSRLHVMARSNPSTGHGAIQIDYGWRLGPGNLYWQAYAFHGYGESLTDYNDSITRVGIGVSLSR